MMEDLNTPVIPMDRPSRQKISKEIQAVNDTLDQMNFIFLYLQGIPCESSRIYFLQAHMEHSPALITSWTIN